jgi:hypothetical protein
MKSEEAAIATSVIALLELNSAVLAQLVSVAVVVAAAHLNRTASITGKFRAPTFVMLLHRFRPADIDYILAVLGSHGNTVAVIQNVH